MWLLHVMNLAVMFMMSITDFKVYIGSDSLWIEFMFEGTRMWRRGADPDGYVANFVETEQILHANGSTSSFVQVKSW